MREEKVVSSLSEIMAVKYGIYPEYASRIRIISALHDVGKIQINENILNKPGKLDPIEYEQMKKHTTHGAKILEHVKGEIGEMARLCALYHHEKWDGKGYWNIPAYKLPVYIHIISICDVAVALLSKRVYKEAWEPAKVIEYICGQSGTQFNPVLVNLFIELARTDEYVKTLFAG